MSERANGVDMKIVASGAEDMLSSYTVNIAYHANNPSVEFPVLHRIYEEGVREDGW